VYYAEIRSSDDTRLGPGTFETAHAYNAPAWRLGRPRAQMNFSDVRTCEQAQELAPPPRLVTEEDRHVQRRWERRLLIAEADEHAMAVWRERFTQDVVAENEFWAQRRAERAARRADKRARKEAAETQIELGEASTWDSDDSRWIDAFTSLDDTTEEEDV
jgi:hypothetical protein